MILTALPSFYNYIYAAFAWTWKLMITTPFCFVFVGVVVGERYVEGKFVENRFR